MVSDLQEIFRALIEQFLITYVPKLDPKTSFQKVAKRTFLKLKEEGKLIEEIYNLFDKTIRHQRIKRFGNKCKIKTAIREEPVKLAMYLRGEKDKYAPLKIISEMKQP